MPAARWSTQQLAEFVAATSTADTEPAAAIVAVERAAEALDAEVAAIVCDGAIIAAVGYPEGMRPVADLETVTPWLARGRASGARNGALSGGSGTL